VFKTMSYEDFAQRAAALEQWCTLLPPENKTLEILREAVDIKKVNSSFIKSGPNDDLIVDAYCQLYMEITPTLDLDVKVEEVTGDGENRGKGPQNGTDQTTKPRIKGVGRRELLRKAEAAGINPALVSAQVLALRQAMAAERDKDGSVKNEDTAKAERFFDIADDDESELSELDDIQSLDDDVMQLVKTMSRSSSTARSDVSAATAEGQDASSQQEEEDNEGRSAREVKTPSDDGMEEIQDGPEPKSPSGETAPE
jgi:hypothetical protein